MKRPVRVAGSTIIKNTNPKHDVKFFLDYYQQEARPRKVKAQDGEKRNPAVLMISNEKACKGGRFYYHQKH